MLSNRKSRKISSFFTLPSTSAPAHTVDDSDKYGCELLARAAPCYYCTPYSSTFLAPILQFGPAYELCFGPKSFLVISDPVMIRHILRDNAKAYDKGVLAEILEPIMGKGLIPADPVTWKVRRRAIVPGFHKAWLNAMVRTAGRRDVFFSCFFSVDRAPQTRAPHPSRRAISS